ncbi:hypothetical protein ACTMU2_31720 [Cupriavidus basilensis]
MVLVHGAFADGPSWNKVIPLLQAKGLANVVSVQNPLSSLADDVAATRRALGHADPDRSCWSDIPGSGVVISEIGQHERVKAPRLSLGVRAFEGQSVADLGKDAPKPEGSDFIIADEPGLPDAR